LYTKEARFGKQVVCVTNFPKKQIANFMSEVLTTGLASENGDIVLAQLEQKVPNGAELL